MRLLCCARRDSLGSHSGAQSGAQREMDFNELEGVVCTPLGPIADQPSLPYEQILCRGCRAVLNPHCRYDTDAKIWMCQF